MCKMTTSAYVVSMKYSDYNISLNVDKTNFIGFHWKIDKKCTRNDDTTKFICISKTKIAEIDIVYISIFVQCRN